MVAIKVDNSVFARPYQRGLRQAAVVYQELVEGGTTRFLAVFESEVAGGTEIGPIRSVRESDIALLRAFKGIAVGFSGGNTGVKATFAGAARKGYVVDASYDAIPGAYRLGERRKDARNFFTTADKLVSRKPGAGPADIGLRFGRVGRGAPAVVATAGFSRMYSVRARYDSAAGTYAMSQGGAVIPVSPDNVIVQFVKIRSSRYSDVTGNPTPYTVTEGSGRFTLLRDGKRFEGTWKRKGLGATRFFDAAGHDLPLKPGRTWIMLLPSTGSLAFGWLAYDAICKSRFGDDSTRLMLGLYVILVGMAWGYVQVFTGRAALLHLGAFTATIMSANVFLVIMPNQRIMVADLQAGAETGPEIRAYCQAAQHP